jgi:hypothetical protein
MNCDGDHQCNYYKQTAPGKTKEYLENLNKYIVTILKYIFIKNIEVFSHKEYKPTFDEYG